MNINKKGFTLVELLAVIVILGVVVSMAMLAIKPRSRNARKAILVNDAKSFMKGATEAYTLEEVEGEVVCHNLSDLVEYVKKDDENCSGTVISEFINGDTKQIISITDGRYYIFASDNVTIDDVTEEMPAGFVSSCDGTNSSPSNISQEVGTSTLAYKLFMNEGKSTLTENLALIDQRTSSVDFNDVETDPAKSGLYKAEDDDGMSYYHRGVVNNNWVSFGGFYWRIIRINGDGSIRLIYTGLKDSNHTGNNSAIKNSKNTYATFFGVSGSQNINVTHTYGSTTSQVQLTYSNGRYGNTHVGYMYNPKKVLQSNPNFAPSTTNNLSKFLTYTNISNSKNDYYFFKNFDMTNDCTTGNDNDESGTCILKCNKLGDDCISSNWNTLATTSGNYSTNTAGVYPANNPTNYIYTSAYKYTCWGNGTPVVKTNPDGTKSVYIPCPIVSEIVGTVKNQATQAKIRAHGLFSENIDSSHLNINDSNVKYENEYWYERNILDKVDESGEYRLEDYVVDEIFCSDRTPKAGQTYPFAANGGTFIYNVYTRMVNSKLPDFKCSNKNRDAFTLASTSQSSVIPSGKGNSMLKYPIGLITIDEAHYAGGKYKGDNADYYLNTGISFHSISPNSFQPASLLSSIWFIHSNGQLSVTNPGASYAIRPVINLRSDVVYKSGSGTEADPYIITL